ncbi:MAG: hypothetical protein QM817_08470 [Archangium sp.]
MKYLALLSLLFVACRTEIKPLVKEEPVKRKVRNTVNDCSVHDYPAATDLPAGSQNIGWVTVKRLATDDETFEALRKEVCAKGGDAMSQMHWLRASGASVADPPVELEANAWVTP